MESVLLGVWEHLGTDCALVAGNVNMNFSGCSGLQAIAAYAPRALAADREAAIKLVERLPALSAFVNQDFQGPNIPLQDTRLCILHSTLLFISCVMPAIRASFGKLILLIIPRAALVLAIGAFIDSNNIDQIKVPENAYTG